MLAKAGERMNAEKGNFRRNLFGGFNREDVIKYIEQLSAERNKYKNDCLRLEGEAEELRARLDEALRRAEAEAKRADEIRIAAAKDAAEMVRALEEKYEKVRIEMEETLSNLKSDILRANDSLSVVTDILCRPAEPAQPIEAGYVKPMSQTEPQRRYEVSYTGPIGNMGDLSSLD